MIIAIASGKGGTGKTTVAANMASSIPNSQLLDCDVEEPNAHIFLEPNIERTDEITVFNPLISEEKCTKCGICVEKCEFNALAKIPNNILFFPELCMSCEACMELCPEKAITKLDKKLGILNEGNTKNGIGFVNGLLDIGMPRAIPIIDAVKSKINKEMVTILDAPPGNSCPVIETIIDSDFCLLVTEPTPFGLYDLKIAVEVVKQLKIPFGIIINRDGMGDSNIIEDYCRDEKIEIMMKIPYKREIAEAYSRGEMIVEILPEFQEKFLELFERIKEKVETHA